MRIIKEGDDIWKAIDRGGGQSTDIIGVVRELDKAGFYIISKATMRMLNSQYGCFIFTDMKAEYASAQTLPRE